MVGSVVIREATTSRGPVNLVVGSSKSDAEADDYQGVEPHGAMIILMLMMINSSLHIFYFVYITCPLLFIFLLTFFFHDRHVYQAILSCCDCLCQSG